MSDASTVYEAAARVYAEQIYRGAHPRVAEATHEDGAMMADKRAHLENEKARA